MGSIPKERYSIQMTNKVQFWHTVVQYLQRGEVLYLSEKTINYGDLSIQAVLSEKTLKLGINIVINGHNLEMKQITQMGHYTHLRNGSSILLSLYSKWPLNNFTVCQISQNWVRCPITEQKYPIALIWCESHIGVRIRSPCPVTE